MSNTDPFKVIVIGCGAVAGGYDRNALQKGMTLSHMGAYQAHSGFEVVACIDPDEETLHSFCSYWKVDKGYATLERAIGDGCIFDVVSLTSPTEFHAEGLRKLLETPIKAIWAEKPLTHDYKTSSQFIADYEAQGIALSVNYFRRFDPVLIKFKDEISVGRWGELQNVTIQYCKGLQNSASHFINLLQFLIGDISPDSVFGYQYDYLVDDPTIDAVLKDKKGRPIFLAGSNSKHMFLGELDFVFEKGRIHLEDVGTTIRKRDPIESPIYPGYTWLEEGTREVTDFKRCFYNSADNLYRHLKFQEPLISDGKSALATAKICDQLLEKLANLSRESK